MLGVAPREKKQRALVESCKRIDGKMGSCCWGFGSAASLTTRCQWASPLREQVEGLPAWGSPALRGQGHLEPEQFPKRCSSCFSGSIPSCGNKEVTGEKTAARKPRTVVASRYLKISHRGMGGIRILETTRVQLYGLECLFWPWKAGGKWFF